MAKRTDGGREGGNDGSKGRRQIMLVKMEKKKMASNIPAFAAEPQCCTL